VDQQQTQISEVISYNRQLTDRINQQQTQIQRLINDNRLLNDRVNGLQTQYMLPRRVNGQLDGTVDVPGLLAGEFLKNFGQYGNKINPKQQPNLWVGKDDKEYVIKVIQQSVQTREPQDQNPQVVGLLQQILNVLTEMRNSKCIFLNSN
jgi:hypothetical protein